jgi:hypothetical protein
MTSLVDFKDCLENMITLCSDIFEEEQLIIHHGNAVDVVATGRWSAAFVNRFSGFP